MNSRKIKPRVVNFQQFLNEMEVQEGIGSKFKSAFGKFGEWVTELKAKIKNGFFKLIPSGTKKGLSTVSYFDPKDGSILDQVNNFYRGSEHSKLNNIQESETFEDLDEARVPLEYTESDQSVRNVDAKQLKSLIEKLYRSKLRGGTAKPIFIYGAPGIGKTQIVAQAADSLGGLPLINLDLQFMAPEDFLGVPSIVDVDEKGVGKTVSNPPSILPRDNGPDDKGGIIFLDEANRANKIVLNSMMQFVQMGRLGEYHLPSKWIIVAAGNRPAEADVAEMDFALGDRFKIVNFVPKISDWTEWGEKSGKVSKEILSFLNQRENEDLFHFLDPDKGTITFPTPRSWAQASMELQDEISDEGVESWRDLPIEDVYNIFADAVGPMAAGKITDYLKVIKEIPESEIEKMVTSPEDARMPNRVNSAVMFGLSGMLISKAIELDGENPSVENLLNIMKFMRRFGKENYEVLAWVYRRLTEKFPYFAVNQEVLNNKEIPENAIRIEAAQMIKSGAQDKDLL